MEYQDDMFPQDISELESLLATQTIKLINTQDELDAVSKGYKDTIKDCSGQIKAISERIDSLRKQQGLA